MKKLMVAMAGMIAAGLATAATSFSYQGVLRGATGEAVSVKNQVISFKIYDGPASETALWGRKCSVLLDDDGLFNVELSDAAGSAIEGLDQELDAVIAAHAGATLYIGLTVQGSSGEIRPRQKILSVPLASYAYDVSLAKRDFTVTGKATFNATETTGNAVVNGTNTVKTLVMRKAHQTQLPARPSLRMISVNRFAESVDVHAAVIEKPSSHHGIERPASRKSFDVPRLKNVVTRGIATTIAKKIATIHQSIAFISIEHRPFAPVQNTLKACASTRLPSSRR